MNRCSNGQPQRKGEREYVWDALGRLVEVRQEDRLLASYAYNHRGERVSKTAGGQSTAYLHAQKQLSAELNAQGQLVRQYIYLADLPLAVIDTPQGKLLAKKERPILHSLVQDLKNLLTLWTGHAEQPVWLHSNHLGAPEAATDTSGNLIWQACYQPFGAAALRSVNGFALYLRLPGQYEDTETGLYYNRQRYYDPEQGQYLSPDPAGNPDGANGYAYVRNNPLKYIDPEGLILFAFDGTGNTEESRTNVYWLSQAYADNDFTKDINGDFLARADTPYYIQGPGTGEFLDGALAYTIQEKINNQLKNLDNYVKAKWQNEVDVQKHKFSKENLLTITLDIVGFSRGAAEARDFANQVIDRKNGNYYSKTLFGFGGYDGRQNCVGIKIRFVGLFDTVLSTSVDNFNLKISNSQIDYVSQAVAVNEHRAMFPLEPIDDASGSGGFDPKRVEIGFIGAHSDIGGGYAGVGGDGGDLSDVALNWMYDQGKNAGVNLTAFQPAQQKITSPIIHDETRIVPWTLPGLGGLSSDRDVRFKEQTVREYS